MNEFIKNGNKIYVTPKGIEYDLEPGEVYTLKYDDWTATSYFEITPTFTIPERYKPNEEEQNFFDRILKYYNTTDKKTTGVMLKGLKGSGKTVGSKKLAFDSKLPIVIVDTQYPAKRLASFCEKFTTPICMLFDEVEKNQRYWDTTYMLQWLDGLNETCKKLVIFTCNDDKECSEFLKDRCSRVRYVRNYKQLSSDIVETICNEEFDDKEKALDVSIYIYNNFKTLSYDNIYSFIEEIKLNPDVNLNELMDSLNIYKKEGK